MLRNAFKELAVEDCDAQLVLNCWQNILLWVAMDKSQMTAVNMNVK